MYKKTVSPGPGPNNPLSISTWSKLQPTVNLKIVNKTNSSIFCTPFEVSVERTQTWESIFAEKELNLDIEAWGVQGPNKRRFHRLTEQVDDVIKEYSNVKQRYTVWLVELPTGDNGQPFAKVPKLESTSMSPVPSTSRDSTNNRSMQLNYMKQIVDKIQALRPQQIKLVVGELEALSVDSESTEIVEDHLYHSLKLLRALFTDDS